MNKLKHLLLILPFATLTTTAQEVRDYNLEPPTSEEMDAIMKNTDDPADESSEWLWSEYLQEDPNCQQLDVDPVFDDEVYIERLRSLPMEVELPYNKIVRSYIDRYTKRSRTQVRRMLGAMNFYTDIFERELIKHKVPLELKYLPVIESALKPEATSPVGAAGLWQFMASTGRQYKLRIDSRVDERRDIVKSSEAAARLLHDLFQKYNDWALVLAAYNCGPGNVNKAISRSGNKRDFWAIYNYLPKETRGYVPAFIAATYVMNYYCEHGICPLEAKYPPMVDTVHVVRDLNMRQVSELLGVGMAELKALNPQYKTDVIPGYSGNCVLLLPESLAPIFASYGNDIYKHKASELLQRRTTVEVGGGKGNYKERDDDYNSNIATSTTTPKQTDNYNTSSIQAKAEQSDENNGRRTRSTFRNRRQENDNQTEALTTLPANNPRQDPARTQSEVSETGVRTISKSIRDEDYSTYDNTTTFNDDAAITPVETNTNRKNNTKADPNRGYTRASSYESNSNNRKNYSNTSRNSNTTKTTTTTASIAKPSTTTTETGARIRKDRTSSATTTAPKKEDKSTAPIAKSNTKTTAPKPAEQPRKVSSTKPANTTASQKNDYNNSKSTKNTTKPETTKQTSTKKPETPKKAEAPKQTLAKKPEATKKPEAPKQTAAKKLETTKKPETPKKAETTKKPEATTAKPIGRQTATSPKQTNADKAATNNKQNNKQTAKPDNTAKNTAKSTTTTNSKANTKTPTKTETTVSKPTNKATNSKQAITSKTATNNKQGNASTTTPVTNKKPSTAKPETTPNKQQTAKATTNKQNTNNNSAKTATTNNKAATKAITAKPTTATATATKPTNAKPATTKQGTNVGKSSGKSGSSK